MQMFRNLIFNLTGIVKSTVCKGLRGSYGNTCTSVVVQFLFSFVLYLS